MVRKKGENYGSYTKKYLKEKTMVNEKNYKKAKVAISKKKKINRK